MERSQPRGATGKAQGGGKHSQPHPVCLPDPRRDKRLLSLPAIGLSLNLRKTTLWGPDVGPGGSWTAPDGTALASVTPLRWTDGTTLLGVPIDAPDHHVSTQSHLSKLITTFEHVTARVSQLADPQASHALQRSCLGPAKVLYALRTCDYNHTRPFSVRVSAIQRRTFASTVGCPGDLTDEQWLQASLPLRATGCGIGDAASIAPVARLAAVLQFIREAPSYFGWGPEQTRRLRTDHRLLHALSSVLPPTLDPLAGWQAAQEITLPQPPEQRQHWWGDHQVTARHAALLSLGRA